MTLSTASDSSPTPGATFSFLGIPSVLRATGSETQGRFFMMEHSAVPPGFASPYHTHRNEDEIFYVLDGEVAFVLDGAWSKAVAGTCVFGPRNIVHGFQVVGAKPARMLVMTTPAAFEQFVNELAAPADVPSGPPDPGAMVATAARYGIDIQGPLPALPDGF